jgi:hypothetical protein
LLALIAFSQSQQVRLFCLDLLDGQPLPIAPFLEDFLSLSLSERGEGCRIERDGLTVLIFAEEHPAPQDIELASGILLKAHQRRLLGVQRLCQGVMAGLFCEQTQGTLPKTPQGQIAFLKQ